MSYKSFKEILRESEESRIMKEKQEILKEMIVYGNKEDDKYVVAFNKWIFLFDMTESINYFKLIIQKLKEVFPRNSFINDIGLIHDVKYYSENIEELLKELHREVKDSLVGILNNDKLYVYGFVSLDFQHSILCKKVLHQLGMSEFSFDIEDFDNTKYLNTKDFESFPDIGYHGTSSSKLSNVLKNGIRPGNLENWEELKHIDGSGLVFFSSKLKDPLYHSKKVSKKNGSTPIIIEFEIPDKSRIIQDYDVEMYTGEIKHYKRNDMYFKKAISNKPLSLSKELGIYAYRGHILPQKIKAIWCPDETKDEYVMSDFIRLSVKDAVKKLGVFVI